MKAITILQPYASLIAAGAKKYETRSWKTEYRGKIAIHAGKATVTKQCLRDFLDRDTVDKMREKLFPEYSVYDEFYLRCDKTLPYGAIIAVADLAGCWKTKHDDNGNEVMYVYRENGTFNVYPNNDLPFGDFSMGRFAWELANVKVLSTPVPYSGKLGLWDLPDDILTEQSEAKIYGEKNNT